MAVFLFKAMNRWTKSALCVVLAMLPACSIAPKPDTRPIRTELRHESMRWSSAVIVSHNPDWKPRQLMKKNALKVPADAEGGSVTPVTADGYFLTAHHVIDGYLDCTIYLCYGDENGWRKARVVWSDEAADLVLLHVDMKTPGFYRWSNPGEWVPSGTKVFHVGIATGSEKVSGKILTHLRPESPLTPNRLFKMDLPLKPGDSGGAVLDGRGNLIGINSAVEYLVPMETAFFVDSEASRPNIRELERIIRLDREQKHEMSSAVD